MLYESDYYTNSYFALENVQKGTPATPDDRTVTLISFPNRAGLIGQTTRNLTRGAGSVFAEERATILEGDASRALPWWWTPGGVAMEYWRPGSIGMEYWNPGTVGMEYWQPRAGLPSPGQIGILPQPSLMPTPGGGGGGPAPRSIGMPIPGGGGGGPAPRGDY